MLYRRIDTSYFGELHEITSHQTSQADIAPTTAGGNNIGPPSNGGPPAGCWPPSKGRGHCSLCGHFRVDPTRAGIAWRECKDCGDPLIEESSSDAIATLIARNLY